MSSRDLAEAEAFLRRRLVTACVSGTAGPHEGRPRRARTAAGGLALAVLLVAGVAVGHQLRYPGDACRGSGPADAGRLIAEARRSSAVETR